MVDPNDPVDSGRITVYRCLPFPGTSSFPPHWKIFQDRIADRDRDYYCVVFYSNPAFSYTCILACHTRENSQDITIFHFFFCDSYQSFVRKFCEKIGLREEHVDHDAFILKNIRNWGFPLHPFLIPNVPAASAA